MMRHFILRMWRLNNRRSVLRRRYEVERLEHRSCRAADILEAVAGDQEVPVYVAPSDEWVDKTWDKQSPEGFAPLEKPFVTADEQSSVIEEPLPDFVDLGVYPQTDFKEVNDSHWESGGADAPTETKENAIDSLLPDVEMPEGSTDLPGYDAQSDASPELSESQEVDEWFPEILGGAPTLEEVACDVSNQVLLGGRSACDLASQTGDDSPSNLSGPQGLEDNPESDRPSKHANKPDPNATQTNTNSPGPNVGQPALEEPSLELKSVQELVRPGSPVAETPRLQLLGIRPLSLMSPPPTIQSTNEVSPTSNLGRLRSAFADAVELTAPGSRIRDASQLTSYEHELPRPQIAFSDLATMEIVHADAASNERAIEQTLSSRSIQTGDHETIPLVEAVYGNHTILRDRGRHRPLLAPLHKLQPQPLAPRQRSESTYEKANRTRQTEPEAESPSVDDTTFVPNAPSLPKAIDNVRSKVVTVTANVSYAPVPSEEIQSPSDRSLDDSNQRDSNFLTVPQSIDQIEVPLRWGRSLEWFFSGAFLASLWQARPLQIRNRRCRRVTNGPPTNHYK